MRPTSVNIIEKPDFVRVGEEYELVCQSLGSKPPADIIWLKDRLRVDREKVTVSLLETFHQQHRRHQLCVF